MTFLRIRSLSKSYPGTQALSDVSLDIGPGEVHALMGENGAGKSTLIKILAGVTPPDHCDMRLDGTAIRISNAADAARFGFRFIHQELNIVPQLSVAENIVLGQTYPRRFGIAVDWNTLNARARDALEKLDVRHIDPRIKAARLSTGDQMLVKIAGTLVSGTDAPARLYVMDEPTAALTGSESDRLFEVIQELKRAGASVLYVSHRMNEVMAICDRITVLRDGRYVTSKPVAETDKDEIIRFMTGRNVGDAYPPRRSTISPNVVCKAANLSTRAVRNIDFELKRGEILGVGGLADAGQSDVLKTFLGIDRPVSGTLRIEGIVTELDPSTAWRHRIGYVPRERRRDGLMLRQSIVDNIVLPHLDRLSFAGGVVNRRRERRRSNELGHTVRLKSAGMRQTCHQLSGGNQQKVVFARAIGDSPDLLLLDEPTRGVDVGAKFDIYSLIRDMSAAGTSVILTSSDLPELLGMCDRIVIMRDGAQTAVVDAHGLGAAELLGMFYA